MTRIEKFEIINLVAIDLQSRFTFSELEAFLKEFKINTGDFVKPNSKAVWVKDILSTSTDDLVIQIAKELNVKHKALTLNNSSIGNEATFWKPGHFKVFISHLASEKARVKYIKELLEPYGISGFVAHEDIEPTKEWEGEIIKALFSMNALVAILQPGFRQSLWTDQEMGIAMGREILIVPLRAGLDPYGFVGKYQGLQFKGKPLTNVANEIFSILISNLKTKTEYINLLVDLFLLSSSSDEGVKRADLINKISNLDSTIVQKIHSRTPENKTLNNIEILKILNDKFAAFGYSKLTPKSFDTQPIFSDDDLPF